MAQRNGGPEPNEGFSRENLPFESGTKANGGTRRSTEIRSIETSRRTIETGRDLEERSADITGPDVINALHVAGDTIKSAGDLAGAVNNIGVTVAGATYVAKKTLGKLKGANDKSSKDNSDRTET